MRKNEERQRFRLLPINADTDLIEWTNNKGFYYLDTGTSIKADTSKQSTYKEWYKQHATI